MLVKQVEPRECHVKGFNAVAVDRDRIAEQHVNFEICRILDLCIGYCSTT